MAFDWNTFWSSIITSTVVTGILAFLGRSVFSNLLSRSLEKQKSELQSELEVRKSELQKSVEETKAELLTQLERDKASWQAAIQREVADYLGERSAEREYVLEARKRLYSAVGPLRFQLLTACASLASRINEYGMSVKREGTRYMMRGYYGDSFAYRLLRPIAICELIERQIAFADFSVDPAGMDALRFKKAAFISLSDGKVIDQHPDADWSNQTQHLFSGTVSSLANHLIVSESNRERVLHFHEFQEARARPSGREPYSSLDSIMSKFSIAKMPLFWTRLVCIGYICSEYVKKEGVPIGFAVPEFQTMELLTVTTDEYLAERADKLLGVLDEVANVKL